jgi:hypothetical protein
MPFTELDLDPTDDTDRNGRAYWIVKQVKRRSFRWFQSFDGFQAEVTVADGYWTNFASAPRFFWRMLPPDGKYRKAAIIHDAMYDAGEPSRWLADAIFFEAMRELDVPLWKRCAMWFFVRLFAGGAWRGK